MTYTIHIGDSIERMREMPAGLARCCVTSPPYWGLRDYGAAGQIGLEATPEAWCARLVEVFREVRRVLADDGTLWVNCGDAYAATSKGSGGLNGSIGGGGGQGTNTGSLYGARKFALGNLKEKDLIGLPWMLAFALRADGWYLRSDIIWHKPNPMPESVTDRPTKAHEYLFLFSKSARYFYDADAIREDAEYGRSEETGSKIWARAVNGMKCDRTISTTTPGSGGTRNRRTVWTVPTQPYPEAHFATYPEKLIEPCILAGSAIGDTVLDPFSGSGTTGVVAIGHQRNYVGVEINPEYAAMSRRRIGEVAPLLAREVVAA